MISIPKTSARKVTVAVFGLVAGVLFAAGCGAEGEGSIKAPSGGVESYLGRPFGEPESSPAVARKHRSTKAKAKVRVPPPDHTNPRS